MIRTLRFQILLILSACTHGEVEPITKRGIPHFEKAGGPPLVPSALPNPAQAPEVFVRRKTVKIEPVEKDNVNGSLFNPDDERNYLFASRGPAVPGKYISIAVVPMRRATKGKVTGDEKKADSSIPEEVDDKLIKELLDGLPEIKPPEVEDMPIVKQFKMKVVHRFPNGDVLASMRRRSLFGNNGSEIVFESRIPYDRIVSGEQLTTADLYEIRWLESQDGQVVERTASGWEDEYTLRLSGFNEAKSKLAMDLDEKRQQIKNQKERLEERIRTWGKERTSMAKEREGLLQQKVSDKQKISKLEETDEEQKEAIEDLTPTEDKEDEDDD